MIPALPKIGVIVPVRADTRRLGATLQSVAEQSFPAARTLLMTPRGREHLLPTHTFGNAEVMATEGLDNSWLTAGLAALAADTEIALALPEGVVLGSNRLEALGREFARWGDLVGLVEIVAHVAAIPLSTPDRNLTRSDAVSESALRSWLRGLLRARSLLPCMLAVRLPAARQIRPASLPEQFDWISFASLLDLLRARGRTEIMSGHDAWALHFKPERRAATQSAYALYARLAQLSPTLRQVGPGSHQPGSAVQPRLEMLRLLGERGVQALSPVRRRQVVADLREIWAARRDMRRSQRLVRRDIREMR